MPFECHLVKNQIKIQFFTYLILFINIVTSSPQDNVLAKDLDSMSNESRIPITASGSIFSQVPSAITPTMASMATPASIKHIPDQVGPLDVNKEVIDYGDSFLDSLNFEETEKIAENNTAKQTIETLLTKHHDYDELYKYLLDLSLKYPEITRLYPLSHESVEHRKLWVLEITEEPGKHKLLKPEFRYIANIHGNEVVGRELLLHLARLLVENYRAAQSEIEDNKPSGPKFIRKLLRSTRIHILPSMNPDGYTRSSFACRHELPSQRGRLNANNIDLNRNFPDPLFGLSSDANTQPEVISVMEWAKNIPFSLSANLHGGALVASYPYDGNKNSTTGYRATPDDDVFRNLALTYSRSHPEMHLGTECYDKCSESNDNQPKFAEGITNGAMWYPLAGGMQDWMYENTNDFEITVEVGCNMYPPASSLPDYWTKNKRPLINYIREVHRGIKGIVTDIQTGNPLINATIYVVGRDHNITTSQYGDYFRILMPGFYNIHYIHDGYQEEKIIVNVDSTMAKIINIKLKPIGYVPSVVTENPIQIIEPSEFTKYDQPVKQSTDQNHSIIVANLILTIVILVIFLACILAYIMIKCHFFRGRTISMELQPTVRSTGTGISIGQHTNSAHL